MPPARSIEIVLAVFCISNEVIIPTSREGRWVLDSFQRESARTKMAEGNTDFDLHLVKRFFDAETCRELITEMQCSQNNPALTYGKGDSGIVDDRVRKVAQLIPSQTTVDHVTRRLVEHREKIEEHFEIELRGCEEPQFLRYGVGDFFVAHQDGNTGLIRLATDKSRRVSVSIFLNDQSKQPSAGAYCGGSLVFSDWRKGAECLVAGEAGKLIAFRSELTHEVLPVTYGERYAIVTWYG